LASPEKTQNHISLLLSVWLDDQTVVSWTDPAMVVAVVVVPVVVCGGVAVGSGDCGGVGDVGVARFMLLRKNSVALSFVCMSRRLTNVESSLSLTKASRSSRMRLW